MQLGSVGTESIGHRCRTKGNEVSHQIMTNSRKGHAAKYKVPFVNVLAAHLKEKKSFLMEDNVKCALWSREGKTPRADVLKRSKLSDQSTPVVDKP